MLEKMFFGIFILAKKTYTGYAVADGHVRFHIAGMSGKKLGTTRLQTRNSTETAPSVGRTPTCVIPIGDVRVLRNGVSRYDATV